MPGFDAHSNLAVSLVATAPSPATSGTSLVVTSGEGSRFPAVPFNAVVGPAGVLLTPANAEIVRATARTSDTLTITRAQEGTTARSIVVGDQIAAAITAKTLTDVEANAWTYVATCSAQRDSTSTSFVDIPDLSIPLLVGGIYQFEAALYMQSSSAAGMKVTIAYSGTASVIYYIFGPTSALNTFSTVEVATFANANATMLTIATTTGFIDIRGFIYGVSGAGNLTVQQQKITSGTVSTFAGSNLKVRKVS